MRTDPSAPVRCVAESGDGDGRPGARAAPALGVAPPGWGRCERAPPQEHQHLAAEGLVLPHVDEGRRDAGARQQQRVHALHVELAPVREVGVDCGRQVEQVVEPEHCKEEAAGSVKDVGLGVA